MSGSSDQWILLCECLYDRLRPCDTILLLLDDHRDRLGNLVHILLLHAAACHCGRSKADTACDKRGLWIIGNGIIVSGNVRLIHQLLNSLACEVIRCEVHQHQMIVCAA